MLFILIWLLALLLSIFFFYKAAGSLSLLRPNMISIVFYYSLLVSSFIGSLLIALDIDNYYMINKMTHDEYRIIGFFAVAFVMVFLPLAMWLISLLSGFNSRKEYSEYINRPVELTFLEQKEFFWVFAFFSFISLGAVGYTILFTEKIPVVELFKQGGADLARLRIEAARHFSGNVLIRNIFASALTPLLSLVAYVFSSVTQERKWKLLFLALFPAAIFINVYDLSKAPIMFYFIMFILLRIYIGKTVLTTGKVAFIGGTGTVLIILMYIFVQGVTDPGEYFSYSSGPIGRIILAQISPAFLHLNLFGEIRPLLEGQSLPSMLIGLFDIEQVRSARLAMAHYFPQKIADGTGGVLNTLYIGEAFANFGYIGIVLSTVYIAVIVQLMFILFIRLPKNPIFLSLFVYFTVNIPRTIVGGFSDFLFNPIWFLLTIILAGMYIFIRFKDDAVMLVKKVRENTQ